MQGFYACCGRLHGMHHAVRLVVYTHVRSVILVVYARKFVTISWHASKQQATSCMHISIDKKEANN